MLADEAAQRAVAQGAVYQLCATAPARHRFSPRLRVEASAAAARERKQGLSSRRIDRILYSRKFRRKVDGLTE
jgi:endonuclease/exonuclease/phosphatase family metal-dependent hydrolase